MREPLLETLLKTSAKVGQLLVPAGSLESHLGRFVFQLMAWTHDEIFKISVLGSAVGIIHDGRYIVICSRHQLKGQNLEDIGLLLPDGSSFISSSGSRTVTDGQHLTLSDAYDIAAFDFTKAAHENPTLKNYFFHFSMVPPDTSNVNIIAFIVVGFPFCDQKYELEDKNHFGSVKRILVAKPVGQPSDEALLELQFVRSLAFNPDGMSGGPAYVVQIVGNEFQVFLGGLVVRAGQNSCYILKSGFIWRFISASV